MASPGPGALPGLAGSGLSSGDDLLRPEYEEAQAMEAGGDLTSGPRYFHSRRPASRLPWRLFQKPRTRIGTAPRGFASRCGCARSSSGSSPMRRSGTTWAERYRDRLGVAFQAVMTFFVLNMKKLSWWRRPEVALRNVCGGKNTLVETGFGPPATRRATFPTQAPPVPQPQASSIFAGFSDLSSDFPSQGVREAPPLRRLKPTNPAVVRVREPCASQATFSHHLLSQVITPEEAASQWYPWSCPDYSAPPPTYGIPRNYTPRL